MPRYDETAVHADVMEYYRLVLEGHRRDADAPETVKADEAILEMVKTTADVVAMNRAMTEGGLTFRLTRAAAMDGARLQARVYDDFEETPLAVMWRKRADRLAAAEDYAGIYAASDAADAEEAPVKEREARLQTLVQNVIEYTLSADASPRGTDLDESPKVSLKAALEELKQRFPEGRFPDLLKLPRFRKRVAFDDAGVTRIIATFEKVNKERLGGRY